MKQTAALPHAPPGFTETSTRAPTARARRTRIFFVPRAFFATMSRSHVSNTTLSLGSTGEPATPKGKKMGERERKGEHLEAGACHAKTWADSCNRNSGA